MAQKDPPPQSPDNTGDVSQLSVAVAQEDPPPQSSDNSGDVSQLSVAVAQEVPPLQSSETPGDGSQLSGAMVQENPLPQISDSLSYGSQPQSSRYRADVSVRRDIRKYLSTLVQGGASLVNSIVGLVSTLGLFWAGSNVFLKSSFVFVAITSLIIAGFSAWRKQLREVEELSVPEILRMTPAEIVSIYEGLAALQGDEIAKMYYWKWIEVSEPIRDFREFHDIYERRKWRKRHQVIRVELETVPDVILDFVGTGAVRVSALRPGEKIIVRGRIWNIRRNRVSLDRCELLGKLTRENKGAKDTL